MIDLNFNKGIGNWPAQGIGLRRELGIGQTGHWESGIGNWAEEPKSIVSFSSDFHRTDIRYIRYIRYIR